MRAIAATVGIQLDGRRMAVLCQMVENLVVGAPCGVMDQMTVACGRANALLALRCQPAELEPPVAIPAALEIWGIDSGIRHAVSGADYGSVRIGAFMGYRIIAELAGFPITQSGPGRVEITDPQFGGYLANVTPSRWLHEFRDHVPEQINGAAFLARYGGSTDSVTRIDPTRTYAVRMPTEHPIHEHHRVETFRALLHALTLEQNQAAVAAIAPLLGECMYQSHASYSACGLGSDGTDLLVHLVRSAGLDSGIYGAKITGGGSGGTVAILARHGSAAAIKAIAAQYATQSGREPLVIGGSSPGAIASGVFVAEWRESEVRSQESEGVPPTAQRAILNAE
jgi:L-arabinokinase